MGWERVIGQDRVVDALKRAMAGRRVAHAYLFHGPDGSGKRAAAMAVGQSLLCHAPDRAPCGECSSCRRVLRLQHPDLHVWFPQPKDASVESIRERLDRLADDPYAVVDFRRRSDLENPSGSKEKRVQYAVDWMRHEVRREVSLRSVEGGYKVGIVTDADAMRADTASAFLKSLEEPTPRTVFLLTTSRIDRLLPTILSRCQRFRFDRLGEQEISAALVARTGMELDAALATARMADGSYSRALDLAGSEELMELRHHVVAYLRGAFAVRKHPDQLDELTESLARSSREQIKFFLSLVMTFIRDVMLVRTQGTETRIVNVDQRETVVKFATGIQSADPQELMPLVEEAVGLIDRNVSTRLVLNTLAVRIRDVIDGEHDARLYVPLVDYPA